MRIPYTALIRAKNSEQTLMQAIECLFAQSHRPDQFVVVDNGSTDETKAIALAAGAIVVPYEDGGSFSYGRAINLGVEAASQPRILIISSHIELRDPQTIEQLGRALDENTFALAAWCPLPGGGDPAAATAGPRWQRTDRSNFNGMNGLSHVCALHRTDLCRQFPFDETLSTAEDQAWARDRFVEGDGFTLCLASHPVIYRNPRGGPEKELKELAYIQTHLLPRRTLRLRTAKMFVSSNRLALRGRMRIAKRNWKIGCAMVRLIVKGGS